MLFLDRALAACYTQRVCRPSGPVRGAAAPTPLRRVTMRSRLARPPAVLAALLLLAGACAPASPPAGQSAGQPVGQPGPAPTNAPAAAAGADATAAAAPTIPVAPGQAAA